ncbi:extracellular solute-binding protein [Paenibacillus sp. GYB003]|uniref:extracellular solute-binding protein n=1 Tax=Paenibacillus sp. GYB003 TaxID=2994392 RepID=UPI002F96596E
MGRQSVIGSFVNKAGLDAAHAGRVHLRMPMLLAAAAAASLLLSACSRETENGAKASDPVKPAGKNPIELVFYQPNNDFSAEQLMEIYGNKIKEKFPHITPKFLMLTNEKGTDLPSLIAAGQKIDIIYSSIGATYSSLINNGYQYDITPLIQRNRFDMSPIEPSTIDILRQIGNGQIYGLPVVNQSLTLFYNKDLFDKFGVPYPKDRMSWDEIYELAKKVTRTEGGVGYKGLMYSFGHVARLNPYGEPYIDPKTMKSRFDSDKFKSLITNLARVHDIPGNDMKGNPATLFRVDRTLAMFVMLTGHGLLLPPDLNWDIVSFPYFGDAKDTGPQSYPNYFYITNVNEHKQDSFEVIAYLTSEEIQTHLSKRGFETILKNNEIRSMYGQSMEPFKNKNVSALFPPKYAPSTWTEYNGLVEKRIGEAHNLVARGEKDVNTALRMAAEQADADIETARSSKK